VSESFGSKREQGRMRVRRHGHRWLSAWVSADGKVRRNSVLIVSARADRR